MSAAKTSARNFGAMSQLTTLIGVQIRRLLVARKTKALLAIQLLPVLGAFVYVMFESLDGLTMFSKIVNTVTIPFLIPLAALFYGGPAIVDEMEGRTLTFLTLRPISKSILFIGKTIAAIAVAIPAVLVPLTLLFFVCLFQSDDMGQSFENFLQILGGSAMGIMAYTTIFATLGAIFASSILASIIYFVVVEILFSVIPNIMFLTVKNHTKTIAGFSSEIGFWEAITIGQALPTEWWVSVIFCSAIAVLTATAGSYVFQNRQYYV